jgi:hypothetical protein
MTQYEYAYASIIKIIDDEGNCVTYVEFRDGVVDENDVLYIENLDPLEILNIWGKEGWKAQYIPSGIPLEDGLFFSAEYLLTREISCVEAELTVDMFLKQIEEDQKVKPTEEQLELLNTMMRDSKCVGDVYIADGINLVNDNKKGNL